MLTLKFGGTGAARDEFEYPMPLAEAEEMLAFAHRARHREDTLPC